jgi:hypothetical protein
MPLPAAVGAAIPLITKAGAFLKGLTGVGSLGKAAASQAAVGAFAKGVGAKGAVGKLGSTMAGRLGPIGFSTPAARTNTALMFGPDLAFGALAGAMTPGDLGDKVIAGGMTGISGAVGGAGLRSMYGGTNDAVRMGLELGGGVGGDMLGQGVADNLLRIKGGGTTPYEKMAADQQKELEQRILQQYLSGKGGYPMGNGMV